MRREGVDGDTDRLEARLRELDGDSNVAALGLGGCDLFLNAADRTYWLREMKRFGRAVTHKPLVDGSGLKGAVEGDTVRFMQEELGLQVAGKKVLVTSAVDRWGIAMAFADAGADVSYGDLLYVLGVPTLIHSRQMLTRAVRFLAPLVVQLPFAWLYPSEADHTTEPTTTPKTDAMYYDADIIVGDYKYVTKFMPRNLQGTWVVTNTTTAEDVEFLRSRGVALLITTTPRLGGRSFGTNVMEAIATAAEGSTGSLTPERYLELLRSAGYVPSEQWL